MSDSVIDPLQHALASTPARVLVGQVGPAYRTATWLQLREDHAVARDAVHTEVDLLRDFDAGWLQTHRLFEVASQASSKREYLLDPERGRHFSEAATTQLVADCPPEVDVQIVLGDGLSATALVRQGPPLLTGLHEAFQQAGWTIGRPFFVRYCRVGIMNDVGELLKPCVVLLLIGERPGLATAESLSVYMAYRPQATHTDAQRNLISNIHARGILPLEAVRRIVALATQMRQQQHSGIGLTEEALFVP